MNTLIFTIVTLCAVGVVAALILYFVAQKFKVEEDPRIDDVEKMLPGANCGGCGFPGCRGLACALVEQDDISSLYCSVGGADCMKAVADYLGKAAPTKEPQVATVRCGGTCEKRPRTSTYEGTKSCAIASATYVGETNCAYGCLGYGDCAVACAFDAIHINPETGLAEVDADKCTACGACVKACPKGVIELRKKWPKNRAVYVSCVSKDKGPATMKACKAGCIGCGKCSKVCEFGAITIENNLAFIDSTKCRLCRKCVAECPTGAIKMIGLAPLPPKEDSVETVDVKRSLFISFWLWFCTIISGLSTIGFFALLFSSVGLWTSTPEPTWLRILWLIESAAIMCGFIMLIKWNKKGFYLLSGLCGVNVITGIIASGISWFVFTPIVNIAVLYLILQIKRDGIEYWKAMEMKQ